MTAFSFVSTISDAEADGLTCAEKGRERLIISEAGALCVHASAAESMYAIFDIFFLLQDYELHGCRGWVCPRLRAGRSAVLRPCCCPEHSLSLVFFDMSRCPLLTRLQPARSPLAGCASPPRPLVASQSASRSVVSPAIALPHEDASSQVYPVLPFALPVNHAPALQRLPGPPTGRPKLWL